MQTDNLDPTEIAKFEAMAHEWWDPDGNFRPLHRINPIRTEFILQYVPNFREQRIVDVGCGGGILSESMARRGGRVLGIDMGAKPLQVAQLHARESGIAIDYQQQTVENLAQSSAGEFDMVTCMEMLEHVPAPDKVIQACAQLLRPGGHLFLSTLNRTAQSWVQAILGAEYILRWLPQGTHDWQHFLKPSELCRWGEEAGLRICGLSGMRYRPLQDRFVLHRDVSVNYLVALEKPV